MTNIIFCDKIYYLTLKNIIMTSMARNLLLMKKTFMVFLATFLLILGIISLVLPVLPGIVLIVISLNLFVKVSDRVNGWKEQCKKVIEKTNWNHFSLKNRP